MCICNIWYVFSYECLFFKCSQVIERNFCQMNILTTHLTGNNLWHQTYLILVIATNMLFIVNMKDYHHCQHQRYTYTWCIFGSLITHFIHMLYLISSRKKKECQMSVMGKSCHRTDITHKFIHIKTGIYGFLQRKTNLLCK